MKRIIFVCAENAGRSQIAEALFNSLTVGTEFIAASAGTVPAAAINPAVVEVMQEKGIDISTSMPKQFHPATADQYDCLISFGCLVKSAFSSDIQARIEDWEVTDPKGRELAEVREIRDAIEAKVVDLISTLRP